MKKVFVVQDSPNRNFLPARKFGELVMLLDGKEQIVLSAIPIIKQLKALLQDFDDDDFLLLSGDPAIIGSAVAVAMEVNLGRVMVLKWDRKESDYYKVLLTIRDKDLS